MLRLDRHSCVVTSDFFGFSLVDLKILSLLMVYGMSCDLEIHEELKNIREPTCPFCDRLLVEVDKVVEPCCSEQDVVNENGMNVCMNCGLVCGYDYVDEYINFYENMHRIQRKSKYNIKYHLYNKLNFMSMKNEIQISIKDRNKIIEFFFEIDKISKYINVNRKRMINMNYILKKLFNMLNVPIDKDMTLSKSKKTLASYKKYWEDILLLIGDRIDVIINR